MSTLVKPASLKSLIEKDLPENPCYINPGILPKGGTLLFGGHSKIGKSFIMIELARALATGTNPFGAPKLSIPEPCKVLIVEMELGEYGLGKRVKKIFAEEDKAVYGDKLWYVSKVPNMQLDTDAGRDLLTRLVTEVQPQVLMLDPIGRMQSYDENASDQIQELFTFLEKLLIAFKHNDMALVMSHHFGKRPSDPQSGRDPLDPYNFRGSSKWFDNPDTLITCNRKKNLDLPWKAWHLEMRVENRQDEPPDDILLTVNKDQDLRVRFETTLGKDAAPVKKKGLPEAPKMPHKQLRFTEA